MKDEELQGILPDFRAKLPDGMTAGIIDFDEGDEPEASAEQQGEPGPVLPDELLAAFAQVAEKIIERLERGEMPEGTMSISALDTSCYHYILDKQGNPVHTEDSNEIMQFERSGKQVIATEYFNCQGLNMVVQSGLIVHNPMIGDEPPAPCWVTVLAKVETKEIIKQCLASSKDEVMENHRAYCKGMHRSIAMLHRDRHPSPRRRAVAQRRIAAGQSVLGKRGQR